MGCGCKGKGNVAPPSQGQPSSQPVNRAQTQTESIQSAIKKTIQKYYNQKK